MSVDIVEVLVDPPTVVQVATPGPQGIQGPAGTVQIVIGPTPPTNPQVNVIWVDTTGAP